MQSLRPFEIAVHECAYQFAHFPRQQIRGYTDHSDRADRQKRKSQSIIAANTVKASGKRARNSLTRSTFPPASLIETTFGQSP